MSDIQAEKASASSDYDKKLIFQVIEQSPGGFALVNKNVKSELRCWYIERLKDLIEQYSDDLKLLLQCAKIMYLLGFREEAFSHYPRAHNSFVSHHGRNHLALGLGNVHKDRREFKEAHKHYECASAIRL